MALSGREILLVIGCVLKVVASQVIELDDSFPLQKGDKPWLIKFYAPWCGHCRKLAPTYHQVYLALQETGIRVAKVDVTKYSSLGTEYNIRGYPTIKFVQGDREFTHRGDRSKEGIIEFAKRAAGPQVRPLPNIGKFNDMRGEHSQGVAFVYIGPADQHAELKTKFEAVAEKYAVLGYFYAGERKVLPSDIAVKHEPTVLVFKDGVHYEFEAPAEGATKASLDDWVSGERFQAFPHVGGGALNEMAELKKKIVLVVTEDESKRVSSQERVKNLARVVATTQRDKYHRDFQFVWMSDPETANSITMTAVELPGLLVLDTETQYHYLPDVPASELTVDTLVDFLEDIKHERSPVLGGTGFLQRIKRLVYDIWTTVRVSLIDPIGWLQDIYNESPWLALMVFGIPSLVISIVCYALCCMEPVDEDALWERRSSDDSDEENEARDQPKLLQGDAETAPKPVMDKDDGHMKKD